MIVVGSTMTTFAMSHPELWGNWLANAEAIRDSRSEEVRFFATFEVDGRAIDHFKPVTERLAELGGTWWTYTIDDGRTMVNTANRLHHICAGRNLIQDYAVGHPDCTHILFLDADTRPPGDCLTKLLEMQHPLVGGQVPTYGLSGPDVPGYPFPVQAHMNTAGFLLAARPVFRQIRWRTDMDHGMTDDPCYHRDARDFLGVETHVRKDVVASHFPESIPAIEHRPWDLTVQR